ncbi:MAG TPA: hypothetical protein VHG69_04030 [Thermoleophilaceae bacterium]|nr:hypothetical protein [Thermoleophilaceae bacterium]
MAACLAALAVGCGEEQGEPVPADLREQLESRLTEAENRLDNGSVGACEDILDFSEPAVSSVLASMPGDVDADVRQRLEDGFSRLWDLVADECRRLEEDQPEPDTTPEPPPPPPEETTPETTPTTPEPQPEEGGEGNDGKGKGDEGGGNEPGGGNGNGQGLGNIPGADGGGTVAPGAG